MEFNKNSDYRIFDSLIANNIHFALYRLPGQSDINLIVQHNETTSTFDSLSQLSDQQGFVIAPYNIADRHPIILIHADIHLHSAIEIFDYLQKITPTDNHTKRNSAATVDKYTFEHYKQVFETFMGELRTANIQKLVLSRTLDIGKKDGFSAGRSFHQACIAYPDNFVYLCHTPLSGTWLGCSPEKLISGQKDIWTTDALAGTQKKSNNSSAVWDDKNREEQQIVVDYMQQQLAEAGIESSHSEAETIRSGNLIHLRSKFEFSLPDSVNLGNLLDKLHPSPAVSGFPKKEALDFIIKNEGYDREYYSGFLGYLDRNNNTDLFVNLRCMKIDNDSLRLYAGGGILTSSNIDSEWDETENKLQTILSIIE